MSNINMYGVWFESDIAKQILSKKYFHEGEDFGQFVDRVSDIFPPHMQEAIAEAIIDGDFLPAGRTLYGAGAKGKFKASLSNCYILPMPEDSLEDINKVQMESEVIYSRGGGCGVNLSKLRPRGSIVNNAARTSTGAVSFVQKYNNSAETIGAHGRRAALMIGLNCSHPDIEEFLELKQNDTSIQGANLSILFTDEFMRAVENNTSYMLKFDVPSTGERISKLINAREFFVKFCESNHAFAEPGAIFIDNVRRNHLLSGYPEGIYRIDSCNPCVSGDTLILTKDGYKEIANLVDTEIEIWNGYEWSLVTPKITGTNQPMKLIKFSNGMELKCTDYHKFVMQNGDRKQANKLVIGDKLAKWNYPIIGGEKKLVSPYTHGFYSGDGTSDKRQICLYGNKKDLLKHLSYQSYTEQVDQKRLSLHLHDYGYEKEFVPDESHSIRTRLDWLAGLIDADGSLNNIGGSISISSISKGFLLKVQLMLSTLGCHSTIGVMHQEGNRSMPDGNGGSKEYYCQESYRLVINACNVEKLSELGLVLYMVKLVASPNRGASRFIAVTDIIDLPNEPVVYCFNESINHTGIFNGIMTAQCAEYFGNAYNSCNLGSINLYNIVKNPFTTNAKIDYDKLEYLTRLGVVALDAILDYGYEMQPLDENRKCIDDWRAIGLGVMGLADMFIAMGLAYGSPESIILTQQIFYDMQLTALDQSAELAKNKGTFGKYDWEYIKESPIIADLPSLLGGDQIYAKIKQYGLRNGSLLSIAPTGSISTMLGVSGGVEPLYKLTYERTTHSLEKSGTKFTVLAKSLDHYLKINNYSGEYETLPGYFVAAHDIDPLDRISMQASIQQYVDNAISSTVNLNNEATVTDVMDLYIEAWELGCKGITVFREGCERTSILGKEDDKKVEVVAKCFAEPKRKLNSLSPMKRSGIEMVNGSTFVGHTACVPNLYTTVNKLDGDIFEVFTNASQGCKSNINTITRLASLALRLGAKVEDVVEELKANDCPACTVIRQRGEKVSKSCGACIGEAIERSATKSYESFTRHIAPTTSEQLNFITQGGNLKCPECGENTLRPEAKCFTCSNCGYSRCD